MLGGGLLGWMAVIIYPLAKYLIPPEQAEAEPDALNAGKIENFPVGSSKIFKFGKKPMILVRSKTGNFHALSATCTHLDCVVQFRGDMDAIWCACHNGKYDLSGRNISGPPPKPLTPFVVKLVKGEIFVSKPA